MFPNVPVASCPVTEESLALSSLYPLRANALKNINNAEKCGKCQVLIRLCSIVITHFLTVMMKRGYIGEFEIIDDHKVGKVVVHLTGRLNKRGHQISPRFDEGFGKVAE